jgi:hypothetical protein
MPELKLIISTIFLKQLAHEIRYGAPMRWIKK